MKYYNSFRVTRLNEGKPIIQADPDSWDNRFTFNPTALYLERSEKNDVLIKGLLDDMSIDDPILKDGVVAIYYRGVPKDVEGFPSRRSSVGLAVFTPDLHIIKRFAYPILKPTDDPMGYDYNGVEDQRIVRIEDRFYLTYCGFVVYPDSTSKARVCLAVSDDLLNWEKLGPVEGDVNNWPNKNAVILPYPVNGNYVMFHRPCRGKQSDYSISLAISDSPTGVWKDCGLVMKSVSHPRYTESWNGMGSSPIHLGDNVYLADYHAGNYFESGERDYFANYALLDFNKFDPAHPERIVVWRIEAALFPETDYEINSPWPHKKTLNCVFPCGSYVYKDDFYLIYGGADAYVLAAKLNKNDLLQVHQELLASSKKHIWIADCLREYQLVSEAT